jgi:imidazolonepropionase-like amidohydrolase
MKSIAAFVHCIALILISLPVLSQNYILINEAEVFNGVDEKTQTSYILIKDNLIAAVSASPITIPSDGRTEEIEARGLFLMPGLIDAHVHTMFQAVPVIAGLTSDVGYVTLVAAHEAENQLLRGFTTVRDLGGASFSLKKAIDTGLFPGPRIYPSGATISQTGGHGDFGLPTDVPRQIGGPLSYIERAGMTIIADGADQVLMRAREQLRQGASQIKVMAGGGVSSNYDPLDVAQYTEREIHSAVEAAQNWGTYVTVHAYTPKAIQTALNAGVACIDHGQMIDEPTMKMLAEKGAWLSLQPFIDEGQSNFPEGSPNRIKQLEMYKGTDNAYSLAKKYKVKLAFGTDILFNPAEAARQNTHLLRMTRWFSPFEVLKMATSDNAKLLAMSGPRNPYQQGSLGVIREGAYADILLIRGNPLRNFEIMGDALQNYVTIIKNGQIVKNTIE